MVRGDVTLLLRVPIAELATILKDKLEHGW
jgi:hypothetical protein